MVEIRQQFDADNQFVALITGGVMGLLFFCLASLLFWNGTTVTMLVDLFAESVMLGALLFGFLSTPTISRYLSWQLAWACLCEAVDRFRKRPFLNWQQVVNTTRWLINRVHVCYGQLYTFWCQYKHRIIGNTTAPYLLFAFAPLRSAP